MLEGNLLKMWEQCQNMFFVSDKVKVFGVPFPFDMADDQSLISKYI